MCRSLGFGFGYLAFWLFWIRGVCVLCFAFGVCCLNLVWFGLCMGHNTGFRVFSWFDWFIVSLWDLHLGSETTDFGTYDCCFRGYCGSFVYWIR